MVSEEVYRIVRRDGVIMPPLDEVASDLALAWMWVARSFTLSDHRPAYRLRIRPKRLDASRAYTEVTGRSAIAGAESYTRRNAEDIHD